jgi:uncharacterized membrane protein
MKSLLSASVPRTERLLNALALLLIIGQFALVIGYYFQLPESIPVHFGMGGKPDRWGGRMQLFVAPVLATFIFLLFWAIRQIPADFYNMPPAITPEIRDRQIRNSHEMMAMLSFSAMIFMIWTLWNWLQAALRTDPMNNKAVPVVFLVLTIAGISIFYGWRAYHRK